MANYKQNEYEALRRRCVELSQAGWKQPAIAQAFGLSQPWVSRTLKKYRDNGAVALKEGKRTGAPTRLSTQQLSQLVAELNKGAEQHGFNGAVWTRSRVNAVIKKLFGVSYDPSQIGRILKKVGWSRQKPQRKARQQDAQAVAQWREERLPELNRIAEAKKLSRRTVSSCMWMSAPVIYCLCLPTPGHPVVRHQ